MAALLPSETTVCIVGAGPSGLACALGLALRGVPFVIVDALEAGHNSSRAVVMQANALEALEAINPALAAAIVADGVAAETISMINVHEKTIFDMRMSENASRTKYGYCLLIGQHRVEERMREWLGQAGVEIAWRKRVTAVREDGSNYELAFESGETLRARYIVAADGSKSSLRQFAGIQFLNPYTKTEAIPRPGDPSFVVADVIFQEPLPPNVPRDRLQMMVGGGGVVLTAPMLSPTSNALFRLYLGVPANPPSHPDAAYLQAVLDKRGPGSHSKAYPVPKIVSVLDSSRYLTRPALAERYVHRAPGGAYLLLVGDAAHKHGPTAGQGMNMGIVDGAELAGALASHIAQSGEKPGSADPAHILDAYSTRRRNVARQVIDMVETMGRVEGSGAGWTSSLRAAALWLLLKVSFVNSAISWKIGGLGHSAQMLGK
ncbi:FAD/NAD(P)-binding domain-containing protein [Mycena indigotica]|uniref:FAD/NAD(P)-binding domain-containing protein n=1 Tax=Mycena indigotica TaxID=2126181 RepID=A0A8H6RYU4_9AGAR|nr:FAD/NAD(P)-binding domain-containing protein [Mycena indigotica]KAF7290255.1 FAD/NAD(P)-binding domain-containing protein [Mycena indigotica]